MAIFAKADKRFAAYLHVGHRELINVAIVLLLLYIVVPHLGAFRSSLSVIRHANGLWVVLALGFAAATSFVASFIYLLLAKKRLRYTKTLLVQLASLFINRLLPAGVGALGLNFEYLRKQKHSQIEAGAVVATNNLLGLIGNVVLLSALVLTTSVSLKQLAQPHIGQKIYWFLLAATVLIVIMLVWFRKLRGELFRTVLGALKNIRGYRTHPLKVIGALLASMILTSLYSLSLLACAHAIGLNLAFGQILLVMTAGVAAGTAVPTPGGLLGVEAGLFAGLVAYKISSADALAVVLIYRFLTYWLALVIGLVAWAFVRRRNYI
jgi:uncharacterized membrane protein YbhN (UPF0104 family)